MQVANSNDFFPGTSERCVLITGSLDALLCAASLVVMKIQEALPELAPALPTRAYSSTIRHNLLVLFGRRNRIVQMGIGT